MRFGELLRLVWINIVQNKFKVVLTSIGIVVGAATIVMVIAIGKGGQEDVAEQFKNLNAGAIDISYEIADSSSSSSGGSASFGGMMSGGGNFTRPSSSGTSSSGNSSKDSMPQMPGSSNSSESSSSSGGTSNSSGSGGPGGSGNMSAPGGSSSSSDSGSSSSAGGMMGGGFGNMIIGGGSSDMSDRMNKETITLSEDDVDDIEVFVPGISATTISYSTKSDVDGGELEEATSYTIAGVKSNYATLSNLTLQIGDFITDSNEENKEKICVIGATAAKEIFGSVVDAYDSILYIDDRPYVVNGVLSEMGSVSSGISPDTAVFIPYSTGIKYITGSDVSPTITVIAEDVNNIETVKSNIETVLAETYTNAEFTLSDAGSKMSAASSANDTLTTLLISMAVIVFIVGGIGIMNVLFVSVKERTNEIGILKALGCSKKDILLEFLFEAAAISIIGGVLGVLLSFGITPIVEKLDISVSLSAVGSIIAVVFALGTGTVFGFYPAWKASRLIPIEALNQE